MEIRYHIIVLRLNAERDSGEIKHLYKWKCSDLLSLKNLFQKAYFSDITQSPTGKG